MPDISVIIPAWNAARFITGAIASSANQSGVTLEILVIDDASTDDTADVVASFDDRRVRYLQFATNRGPAAARNAALDLARGRWIAVLDADDTMLPGRLAQLVTVAETNQLDIVADNIWVDSTTNGHSTRSLMWPETLDGRVIPVSLTEYLLANRLFDGGRGYGYLKPLFRAGFLRQHHLRYNEALRISEDFHLVLEALVLGARCARHMSAGYVYVTHAESTSHRLSLANARAMIDADIRFLERFGTTLDEDARQAAAAHLRSLTEGTAFIAMVDCIKRRRLRDLWDQARRHPRAIRHFSMPMRAALTRLRSALA